MWPTPGLGQSPESLQTMPKGERRDAADDRGAPARQRLILLGEPLVFPVTGSSLPLSGLFAIDKPSGVVTMKLLNQINELMATSDLFLPVDKHNDNDDNNNSPRKRRKGHHHRSRAGKVKLGQGGTLDPLASGVLGEKALLL